MPAIVQNADYATFINVFKCKPGDQEEVVRINVEIIDRVAVGRPGFISASVHRSTDGTRVFNYLQWESPQHLASMQGSAEFRELGRRFAGLIEFEPHQCEVVHVGEGRPDDGVRGAC
jgi:heme-degrading monooxygenase HmoA